MRNVGLARVGAEQMKGVRFPLEIEQSAVSAPSGHYEDAISIPCLVFPLLL